MRKAERMLAAIHVADEMRDHAERLTSEVVRQALIGHSIEGAASAELIAASAAERSGTGAVAAYLDGGTWRSIDDSEVSRYEARGETVRTVYVEE